MSLYNDAILKAGVLGIVLEVLDGNQGHCKAIEVIRMMYAKEKDIVLGETDTVGESI